MFYNISVRDKFIRIVLAIIFFSLGATVHPLWLIGSIVMFVTAATDSCIVYKILGINRDLEQYNHYLQLIPKHISKPVLIFSAEGKLLFRNEAALQHIPLLMSLKPLKLERNIDSFIQNNAQLIVQYNENSSVYQLSLSGIDQENILILYASDITTIIEAQNELHQLYTNNVRLKNLYAALSESNQAILHSRSEEELFPIICRGAVEFGGINMAWIGMHDPDTESIKPVASYGMGVEYLQNLIISVDPEDETSQCPTGKAFYESHSYWCQDFLNDPLTRQCHEHARTFSWGGVATLPLYCDGKTVGVFTVYAQEVGTFSDEIQKLLEEMAMDISYSLDNFDREVALKREKEIAQNYLDIVAVMILVLDVNKNVKLINQRGCEILGYSADEIIGKNWMENFIPEHSRAQVHDVGDTLLDPKKHNISYFENSILTKNGEERLIGWRNTSLLDLDGNIIGILTSGEDITDQKNTEFALQASQKYLQTIVSNEPECVKLVSPTGQLLDMNPAGLAMLEVESLEEAKLYKLTDYVLPEWRVPFIDLMKRVMNGENGRLEFEIQGLKGTRRWLETHATPLRDSGGNITMLLGITRDTTERKINEKHIQYLASYDTLTGLPNRTELDIRIKELLSLAKHQNQELTAMFLDLDHFKDINDSLGHTTGDKLLVAAAQRLKRLLREEDTLARLGGDEFIILLPNISVSGASHVAQMILELFNAPFQIGEFELNISVSIGIAIFPADGDNFETLYKNADIAMYRAKKDGRSGFCFFTEEMQHNAIRSLALGNALRHALERNELQLYYQPQFSAIDERIIGAEALLRWSHPEFGSVSPAEFIPIAEESGIILSIGEWVLRSAVKQAKTWMDQGGEPIVIAVNLSAIQFRSPNLPLLVTSILEEAELQSEYLELELTESVAMNDPQKAIKIMDELHQRGIRMSIDDFGTGYSSLSYLKKFNIYKIKIDQSFVRDINTDPEDKAIVSAIISMSQSLGLQTIAEGVETIEQLNYLREQGCDEMQGYYFSKPLPKEEFESLYRK